MAVYQGSFCFTYFSDHFSFNKVWENGSAKSTYFVVQVALELLILLPSDFRVHGTEATLARDNSDAVIHLPKLKDLPPSLW